MNKTEFIKQYLPLKDIIQKSCQLNKRFRQRP